MIGPQVAQPCDAHINCQDTFSWFRVDNEEILEAIRHLKPNFSTGADLIPCFIIKGCGDLLAPISKHIFNLSLGSGAFPLLRRKAVVVTILKRGDISIVGNYCPVSLLCGFSKTF